VRNQTEPLFIKMLPAPYPVKLVRRLTSSIKAFKEGVSKSQSASCVKGPANTSVNLIYMHVYIS
jgi:hypothetical protein